jgi:hypothetical protein
MFPNFAGIRSLVYFLPGVNYNRVNVAVHIIDIRKESDGDNGRLLFICWSCV